MKVMAKKMKVPLEYLGISPVDPQEIPEGPKNPLIRRVRTPTPERLRRKLNGTKKQPDFVLPERPPELQHVKGRGDIVIHL